MGWGASWGVSWGDAWGGSDGPTPPAPVQETFYSGSHQLPTLLDREKHVRRQRELLGILPKPVQAAVQATVKEIVETEQAPMPVLKRELERREVTYKPDYLEAVRNLLIVRAAIDRQIEQHKKQQREDEEALLMLI